MIKEVFKSTTEFYKNMLGDIMILVFSVLGGIAATMFDILRIGNIFDSNIVFGIYTLVCLVLSFPIILFFNLIVEGLRTRRKRTGLKENLENLRLADGMPHDSIWREYEEHSLTIINDTGRDIKKCYIMLDEVAWKNFKNRWEVVTKDVFSKPFKWNRNGVVDGKIDMDNGDRASFVIISHNEYSIYNTTHKNNEVQTNFNFVFFGDEQFLIGYGSNIRLRISVRGKDESGESFEPVIFLLYVHLLQHHGIPKVDVIKTERVKKHNAT
jgi:hypothetical protein